jgi:hypothetical protein
MHTFRCIYKHTYIYTQHWRNVCTPMRTVCYRALGRSMTIRKTRWKSLASLRSMSLRIPWGRSLWRRSRRWRRWYVRVCVFVCVFNASFIDSFWYPHPHICTHTHTYIHTHTHTHTIGPRRQSARTKPCQSACVPRCVNIY